MPDLTLDSSSVSSDTVEEARPRLPRYARLALAEAVLEVSAAAQALEGNSLESVARVVAAHARRLIPDAECVISVVPRADAEEFTVIAGAGPWAEAKVGHSWPLQGTINGRALRTLQITDTNDAPADSSLPHVFENGTGFMRVGRLVPIFGSRALPDGRDALGVLGFWRSHTEFSEEERLLIDAFSRHCSLHMVKFELFRLDTLLSRRLDFAQRLSLDLQASLNAKEVIDRLLRTVIVAGDADRATLSTIADGMISIRAVLAKEGSPDWVGKSYPLETVQGQPQVKQALEERRPVVSGALDPDTAQPEFRDALARAQQTLTVPLIIGDRAVGMLVLSRFQGPAFTPEDTELMQLAGQVTALALRNASQYERLRELAQAKGDFMNMAAHELRTPVTVIQGYLDLIQEGHFGGIPEALAGPVGIATAKTAELVSLVDNILGAARLQADPAQLLQSRFDLCGEVQAAVNKAQGRLALLRGKLRYEPPSEPVYVQTSREYVGRILDNLINNAMTYHRGKPEITVSVSVSTQAEILVPDAGLGMPAATQSHIFEEFFRIPNPPWNQAAGTGLGLYLSRQCAHLAGGELELLHSEEGVGTTFRLTLPLASEA